MITKAAELDTPVIVELSKDRLTATLRIRSDAEPGELTSQTILAALEKAQIVSTDSTGEAVDEFIRRVADGEPPSEPFVVCRGRLPTEGENETFVWDDAFQQQAVDWQGDAPLNYYETSSIVTVETDVVIGTLKPLVPAQAGFDVMGKTIPPKRQPDPVRLDDTVRRCPDDPTQIISNVAGRVVDRALRLGIDKVLIVRGDVSFATGNIESTTDVQITGTIPDRFEVTSAKSVTVGGGD